MSLVRTTNYPAALLLSMAAVAIFGASAPVTAPGHHTVSLAVLRVALSDKSDSDGGDSSTDGGGSGHGYGDSSDGAGGGRPDHGCEVTTHNGDCD